MTDGGDPAALGQLLRSRRERLVPGDVGLPAGWSAGLSGGRSGGRRRRAAGLRREEVALLANVSVTYYTYLEQGRPVRPSAQVLDALAAALRMSAAERRYLHVLAYGPGGADGSGPAAPAPPERLDPAVADLVQRLEPFPAVVKGRRWDVLAANPAARELFADWAVGASRDAGSAGSAGSAGERNLIRWMFTSDQAREVYLEWEAEARAMLGRFRLAAARYPDDPDVSALIAELQRDSEHVRDWWPRHDVAAMGSGSKKLRHPRLGPVEYSHVVLQVADQPDQTLVTYSPVASLCNEVAAARGEPQAPAPPPRSRGLRRGRQGPRPCT
jgi:transcriptional regulator with XRE-family HTH domain